MNHSLLNKMGNYASEHSIINDGNNNVTNQTVVNIANDSKPVATVSLIYDVCKVISEMEFSILEEYSIAKNSEWNEKIEYNEIEVYKLIFRDQYYSYDKVERALKQISKRDLIVRNISTLYQKEKTKNENKDDVLEVVFQELSRLVIVSGLKNGDELSEEEKNDAIYSVMFYVFTKCQLLEPVPDDWTNEDG